MIIVLLLIAVLILLAGGYGISAPGWDKDDKEDEP